MEFGEWLCEEVLKAVPNRHFVFSIPKILRRYFLYDRKLLSDPSRFGWESLKEFFKQTVPEKGVVPVEDPVPCGGAVIAIQTFGDFFGFNPHLHVLCSDGCFYGEGMFRVAPPFTTKTLEEIFPAKDGIFDRHKVFKMLLSKGKITEDLIDMLMKWRHSNFNVFCGPKIQPGDENAMENLARYIVRASFSQERMTYVPEEAKVVYKSKDRKQEKIFDALDWIAAMCSHAPNKGEQLVCYYGYYGNVTRGKRKIRGKDELIPSIFGPVGDPDFSGEEFSKDYNRNWARLIQKNYEVDPLTRPKCQGRMRVIAFIEDPEIVKKILKHLGLWNQKARPPSELRPEAERTQTLIDDSLSQVPASDNYLYVDPQYPDTYMA